MKHIENIYTHVVKGRYQARKVSFY